ncbi:MAG TPA: hypothetical protein VIV14_12630, partial [Gammaproteobacteria bacterium]
DSVLIDEARTPLILSGPSDRNYDPGVYATALELASRLDETAGHFELSAERGSVRLNSAGRDLLDALSEGLPDPWRSPRRREELVINALVALILRVRDRHYIVRDGAIKIIDDNTGRVMADRSWQGGIQQLVEVKEGCDVSEQRDSLARITYQRFFRRYMRLGAMSGTAMEAAGELASVYDLRVFRVPSHKPTQRRCLGRRILPETSTKWKKVLERIKEMREARRPVLIGTRTVEASEWLGQLLTAEGIDHEVLNARQDAEEARIVARAGRAGQVTIATNMAGRGTDIKIDSSVKEAGGLHVIATERNEAKRIDRQLFGRCGRQGDPGSFEEILAYDDDLLEICAPRPILRLLRALHSDKYPIVQLLGTSFMRVVQANVERRHARHRRELLEADRAISDSLAFTGPME